MPKNGLFVAGVHPPRNELPCQQKSIHKCDPEELSDEPLLPRFGFPHPVQPQNILAEAIMPVDIAHLRIVHPDEVRAIDPDVVIPPIVALLAFHSLSTRFGYT